MLDLNQPEARAQRSIVLENEASAVTLPRGELYFGRSVSCFMRLEEPGISRVHFRITVGETAVIEDLGSTNGTLVNGERLTGPRTLSDGDMIAAGNRIFRVGYIDTADLAFEDGEVTPFPRERTRQTLPGMGGAGAKKVELGQRCPSCQATVGVGADLCPSCGYRWPRSTRPQAATEPEAPAVYCRRRHRRHAVSFNARLVCAGVEVEGEVHNLSRHGLFFAAERLASVGERCTVQVLGPDGERVSLPGFVRHVIHRGGSGMGIELTTLEPEAEQWLAGQLIGRD